MSEKFQADPSRGQQAIASLEALRDLIYGMADKFSDSLEIAPEILGHDKFGQQAGEQLRGQKLQLHQVVYALGQVVDAVPQMLASQRRYASKSQQGVIDAIHQSGPVEPPPEIEGKSGKY